MKVWLGAAAALSGAGTLAYLLVRSSRWGRGDGTPSKASETHIGCTPEGSEDLHDASIRKDGSSERLNGHLPIEGHTDSASGMHNSAECYNEAKQQNLSESTLTSDETCDIKASVERLSSNLDENLCELVSAIQEKIVVKEESIPNTKTCVETNIRQHTDDKGTLQAATVKGNVSYNVHTQDRHQEDAKPGPENDEETRECLSTYAVEEKKVASCKREFLNNVSNQKTICSDISSSEGTVCVSQPTEASPSTPEPVVEELSQCLILKPQCGPSCCEDHIEACHHTTATVPSELTKFANENNASFNTEEATHKSAHLENSDVPPERHYTLLLKSSQEDLCISGKHIHDPSPTEPPLDERFIEGQERSAELDKDEPETCIVTIEQREVYQKQVPPDPHVSSQAECPMRNESLHSECSVATWKDSCDDSGTGERTTSYNTKEDTALETDNRVGQLLGTADLQAPATEKEQIDIKEYVKQEQVHSDGKQEVPQEQKKNASGQEKYAEEQEHIGDGQLAPKEEHSSNKQQEVPREQKRNASEQERSIERQEHSGTEESTPEEEEQSCCNQKEVSQEQKKNASKQERNTKGQEHSETKQSTPEEAEESGCKQKEVSQEQKKNTSKQERNTKGQEHSETKQSTPEEEEQSCWKKQEIPQEQKQSNSKEKKQNQKQEPSESKHEVVIQKQKIQEVTLKQERIENKQETVQKHEESSTKQESRQIPRQSNKKELGTAHKQEQKSNKQYKASLEQRQSNNNKQIAAAQKQEQKEETQKQKESDKEQKPTQEEQSSPKKGTQKQKESDKKQTVTRKEKSSHAQDTEMQKLEGDDKQPVTHSEEEMSQEKNITTLPVENAKDQVSGDQMVLSPSRCNNNGSDGGSSKKGSVRSRGDSASADLDCDLGSEQDNLNCDSSSLKSMDSGQGSSEIEPETLFVPSTFPVVNQEQYIFYDFEIPQMLVGRLIGRKGAFINKIKAATEATVIVHPHKNRKLKLCSVEGTKQQVNAALEMIREHFPENQYPDITLQQVSSQHQNMPVIQPTLNAPSMQIELTAGVVVEVRVSAVVSGGELWVQQPLHPSYSALHRLQTCMNLNYGDGSNTPPLPSPISDGTVCVAHIKDHWMRCQVLSSLNGMSLVLPLDVGGTVSLPSSSLRQIRYDYMTLPFQATQCFLHGLQPIDSDTWSDIAASVMEELVSGVILFAVVVSYTEDYVPLVNLYRRDQDHFVLLNEKLVELGHAQWISPQPSS